jgi:hypothetical protein
MLDSPATYYSTVFDIEHITRSTGPEPLNLIRRCRASASTATSSSTFRLTTAGGHPSFIYGTSTLPLFLYWALVGVAAVSKFRRIRSVSISCLALPIHLNMFTFPSSICASRFSCVLYCLLYHLHPLYCIASFIDYCPCLPLSSIQLLFGEGRTSAPAPLTLFAHSPSSPSD